jgi:ubiquinone biosynthesis monooxygenase Coq7
VPSFPYNRRMQPSCEITDRMIGVIDAGLRACFADAVPAIESPGDAVPEPGLDASERRESIALMRVNHAGEIAAQALYAGQAVFARDSAVRDQLEAAAAEERDHLAWCEKRLQELGGAPSLLAPLWYFGSAAIGVVASLAGDRWSLGFLHETEIQVEAHLEDHLSKLPRADDKSRHVLRRMAQDEARHGQAAAAAGGGEMPSTIKTAMRGGGELLRQIARFV